MAKERFRKYKRPIAKKKAFMMEWRRRLGNATKCCKAIGIDRSTYYEWKKSDENFALDLEDVDETVLDIAENTVYHHVMNNKDLKAALEVLKKKGRKRGWGEHQEVEHVKPIEIIFKRSDE